MDLFNQIIDKTKNWLPQDGTVNYSILPNRATKFTWSEHLPLPGFPGDISSKDHGIFQDHSEMKAAPLVTIQVKVIGKCNAKDNE